MAKIFMIGFAYRHVSYVANVFCEERRTHSIYHLKMVNHFPHVFTGTHILERTGDDIWINSNRSNQVLRNFQMLLGHGRLADTGYLSIFPVDQGIEHSAGASFAPNPIYFDPENIIRLALESGCNAVASTFGVLGIM